MDENDSLYCIKCGKQLRAGAKFCNACGTKVPTLEDQAPAPIPQPIPAPMPQPVTGQQPAKKGGKGGVFALILSLLAAGALGTLIAICKEIYSRDDIFLYACIGIAAFAAVGLVCFIASKKGKAGIIGGVLSLLVLTGLGGYAFWYIPQAKDKFHDDFMDELKSVKAISSSSDRALPDAYPYSSASMFYSHERKYRDRIIDYMDGLFEKNEPQKWVAAGQFLNKSGIENIYDSAACSSIVTQAVEIDAAQLSGYTVFDDVSTPVGKAQTTSSFSGIGRMKSDLKGRITQAQDQANGKSTIIMSYGGKFYLRGEVVIYRDNYGLAAVDLTNGNCFSSGDWL
ncbi:MAG: zinc ribbon domain-containing protein [Ruminococcus sp.]|nr:zinc ribbon domain-containing protein [Ruminococcus sp.]